jgi:Ca-activated chloride channel family protein
MAAVMAATGAKASEPPSVVVIVDASRSMWGTIEGSRQTKLALVREALRPGLGKIGQQTRVGLAAFGHRRPGDCADVEVIRAPEQLDIDRIMTPLDQLSPRGVGPLTLALREAAKSLPRDSGRRSLLLIHDDADNCQPDVCAAAAELRTAGITVHVIGIAAKAADMAKMVCLPQATGGRHFNAQNAEQAAIFIDEALRMAGGTAGPDLMASTGSTGTVVPPAPIPASGPTALHLRAQLAANTEPVSLPLRWIVSAEAQPDVTLFDAVATNPAVPVVPGRYIVEVHDALVSARQTVAVRDNRPAGVPVILGAGAVRVRATVQKTGALLNDAIISISQAGGAGTPLAILKTGETLTLLPPGRFVVRAELGLVQAEETVAVTAGKAAPVDLRLNIARLQLTTSGRDGILLEAPIFSIARDDPDVPGAGGKRGKREVARSAARQAEFVLPPDTYYVIARQGSIEASAQVAIGPGEVKKHALTVQAGRLALSTKPLGPRADPVSYTVERIDDPGQESVSTSRAEPLLLLPSGRYRVEGRYGSTNVRSVREVEIKSGQTLQLVFEHQATTLRLRFADGSPSDTFWDVRDETGRSVWMSTQAEGLVLLQAGRYLVQAEAKGKLYRARGVELRPGEPKVIEIVAD